MTIGAVLTLIFFLIVFALIMRRAKPARPARNKPTTDSPATAQTRYKPTGNDATLAVLTTPAILAASSSRGSSTGVDQSYNTEDTFVSSSDLSDSFSDPFDIDW